MHHRKHMSRDHYLLLCDVTADMENTTSSVVACWTMFTELLPGNALIKSVTLLSEHTRKWWQSLTKEFSRFLSFINTIHCYFINVIFYCKLQYRHWFWINRDVFFVYHVPAANHMWQNIEAYSSPIFHNISFVLVWIHHRGWHINASHAAAPEQNNCWLLYILFDCNRNQNIGNLHFGMCRNNQNSKAFVGAYHNASPGQLPTSGWLAEQSKC
jgi:hypothetical protein